MVRADRRVAGVSSQDRGGPWPEDFALDPDSQVDIGQAPPSSVNLPLKTMTSAGLKTGTQRVYLGKALRHAKPGDCVVIVGPPGPGILVRPRHPAPHPLQDAGAWIADADSVWWLEWEVVDSV